MAHTTSKTAAELAFCIPTYKRPALLKKCVESIIQDGAVHDIHIYIADDSGDDTNDEVMAHLMRVYPHITYTRNSSNLGIDKNIQYVVSMCETRYAWLIGEDDIVFPGAIARALTVIAESNAKFIYSNYIYVSNDHSNCTGKPEQVTHANSIIAHEFFEKHLWKIGFIGACIINRSSWDFVSGDDYIGTYFAHVGRIFSAIEPTDQLGVISEANVGNRAENTDSFTWSKNYYDVFFGYEEMLRIVARTKTTFSPYIGQAIALSRKHFKYKTIRSALIKKAKGIYTREVYKQYFASEALFMRCLYYSIAVSPNTPFSLGMSLLKRLLNK